MYKKCSERYYCNIGLLFPEFVTESPGEILFAVYLFRLFLMQVALLFIIANGVFVFITHAFVRRLLLLIGSFEKGGPEK